MTKPLQRNHFDNALFYLGQLALALPILCFVFFFVHLFWSSQGFFFGVWSRVEPQTLTEFIASVVRTLQAAGIAILISFPLGLGTALYLEECNTGSWLERVVNAQIIYLTRIPSIIFGLTSIILFGFIIGLAINTLFVGLVLSCMALPVVVHKTQLALRTVPPSYRETSFALGATRWSTIKQVILPSALRQIVSGSSFAFARILGEAAPLVILYQFALAGQTTLTIPGDPEVAKTVPVLIYEWTIKYLQSDNQLLANPNAFSSTTFHSAELFSSLSAAVLMILFMQGCLHVFGNWFDRPTLSPTHLKKII